MRGGAVWNGIYLATGGGDTVGYSLVLVEDKLANSFSLAVGLAEGGHHVALAHTSRAAALQVHQRWPDAVILNLLNGELDPISVCRELDETKLEIPRLILAEKARLEPLGTTLGADDILTAPYTLSELSRRLDRVAKPSQERFQRLGDIILDMKSRQVLRAGETYSLTPKEFSLLTLLASRSGEVVSRRTIMNEVWQTDYLGDTRTLDVHICWLRQKIEVDPSKPKRLVTMRGVGYRLLVPEQA